MRIKILGSGCANCAAMERATRTALAHLGWQATIEHITDYPTIASYGVMSTPALVLNEHVLLTGRVPSTDQVADLLATSAPQAAAEPSSKNADGTLG